MTARRVRKRPPPSGSSTLSVRLRGAIRQAAIDDEDGVDGLARRAGVNVRMLTRFLRGERSLSLPTVDRLAAALGLALQETGRAARTVSARETTPQPPANLPEAEKGKAAEKADVTPTLTERLAAILGPARARIEGRLAREIEG